MIAYLYKGSNAEKFFANRERFLVPVIKVGTPCPSVADLIERHEEQGTIDELVWYTERDTIIEHLKNMEFPSDEVARVVKEKPSVKKVSSMAQAAALADYLCRVAGCDFPEWLGDDDARRSLRSPLFGPGTRQEFVRKFLNRTGGLDENPYLKYGIFEEDKDYRVI